MLAWLVRGRRVYWQPTSLRAGVECAVFERLSEEAARARAPAGLIEARTVALLDRHGLADGLHTRGFTARRAEFRRGGGGMSSTTPG